MPILAFPLASQLGSGFSFVPGGGDAAALGQTFGGSTDMLIDPVTLDYVRTPTGEWAETADSRTLMMAMLEIEFGTSPFDPNDGTTLAARRRDGDPITQDEIEAETLRVADILVREGLIADVEVTTTDAAGQPLSTVSGRSVVAISWRDLASGHPVDLAISG